MKSALTPGRPPIVLSPNYSLGPPVIDLQYATSRSRRSIETTDFLDPFQHFEALEAEEMFLTQPLFAAS
jgi:hypothetical protein